ncbi:MAG: ribosome maturation factor RimM [Nitrospiraceae bacterium]|nr:ribosome maturation factor RimM [Nitrospiraceae bacterium]
MKTSEQNGYLAEIGTVSREWGIRGELLLRLDIDIEQLEPVENVMIDAAPKKWRKLRSLRLHKGHALISLEGIETPEDAKKFRGAVVSAYLAEEPVLPEGVYLHSQIIGLNVKDVEGAPLGRVVDIIKTRSNDVYAVSDGKSETLVPAIKDVVRRIDLENSVMIVSMPEMAE